MPSSVVIPGSTKLAEAVARAFLAAGYKDEYEVARLHVDTGFLARLARDFDGSAVSFPLAPPLFRDAIPSPAIPARCVLAPG